MNAKEKVDDQYFIPSTMTAVMAPPMTPNMSVDIDSSESSASITKSPPQVAKVEVKEKPRKKRGVLCCKKDG